MAMVIRVTPVLAVAAAGCSLWIDPDESRLQPPDAGPEWCDDPTFELEVEFPKSGSAVLGIVPIRVRAYHCSGIARVDIGVRDDGTGRLEPIGQATPFGDDRFVHFWDTASLAGGKRTLEVAAIANRPGAAAQHSLKVVTLRFDPPLVPGSPGLGKGVSVLDFDGDGRDDLLWGPTLRVVRQNGQEDVVSGPCLWLTQQDGSLVDMARWST